MPHADWDYRPYRRECSLVSIFLLLLKTISNHFSGVSAEWLPVVDE